MKDIEFKPAQKNCSPDFQSTNINPSRADNESSGQMDVPVTTLFGRMSIPVQLFGRRAWFVLGLLGLLLVGSVWTGIRECIFISLLILLILLIISDRTKLSVDSDMLRVSTPILGEIAIPKNNIEDVEIIDNYYIGRHRLQSYIAGLIMIIYSTYRAITSTQYTAMYIHVLAAFAFIGVLCVSVHKSHYPKMIKMTTDRKSILLYPGNETDLLTLKDIVPQKED